MAFTATIIDTTQRPWGLEVRVDVLDDSTGETFHETLVFDHVPNTDERTAARQMLRDKIQEIVAGRPAARLRDLRARRDALRAEYEALVDEIGTD